jgi:hypothetical protein
LTTPQRNHWVAAATPPSAGELIEPGRALALSDFDPPETTAGERLIRLAYRLGISGATLAAPFRKPARPRDAGDRAKPARRRPRRRNGLACRPFPRPRGQGSNRPGRLLASPPN